MILQREDCMTYCRFEEYDKLIKRKCLCGGNPKMILDLVQDYIVRCEKCHESTDAYMRMDDAVKAWERNECTGPLDLLTDDLERNISNIKQIYIDGEGFCKLNHYTFVCSFAIIDTGDLTIGVEHDWNSGYIDFSEVCKFTKENYKSVIGTEESYKLDKIKYYNNKNVEAVRYKSDESFLFIFGTEDYLFITKSKEDLFEKNQIDFPNIDIYFQY